MSRLRPYPARPERAFTLVELLVSIAVLSMLTFALFNILNATASAWGRSEQQADALREARGAIDLMSRDLQSIAYDDNKPTDPAKYDDPSVVDPNSKLDVLLYGRDSLFNGLIASGNIPSGSPATGSTPPPVSVEINPGSGGELPSAGHGDAIFFLARLPTNAQEASTPKSDVCTIGYYLAYTPDTAVAGARRSFKLYRHLQSAKATFGRLSGDPGTRGIKADATVDDVLARNVVDLNIRLLAPNPGAPVPAWVEMNPWPTRVFVKTSGATTTVTPSAPAAIEVEFTCLGTQGAALMQTRADWEAVSTPSASDGRQVAIARLSASQKQTFKFRVHVRR